MMSDTSISIALATCNGHLYLREQLESLEKQVCKPDELVVCDDASTDDTIDILAEFAAHSSFPVHCTRNNQRNGPCKTFLAAVNNCQSNLIAFCDQDDVWHPQKIKKCKQYFRDPDVVMVVHSSQDFFINNGKRKLLNKNKFKLGSPRGDQIRPDTVALGMCMLIRRSSLSQYDFLKLQRDNFYEESLRERDEFTLDHWSHAHDLLFLMIARLTGRIAFTQSILAFHRLHENNYTTRQPRTTDDQRPTTVSINHLIDSESYFRFADHCIDNINFFRGLKLAHPPLNLLADTGISYYKHWKSIFQKRGEIYSSKSLGNAASQVFELYRLGGYRGQHQNGLGYKSLLKDLVHIISLPS